jgi:mRNA-degrading endonuclease toxin of MazEF toxin-antitoxin module
MTYSRGDVVFVPFMFTDKPAVKNRPALIISSPDYHASRREIVIAAITSHIREPLFVGDHRIGGWQTCGLSKPSVVTSILWTVKASMIRRRLGSVSEEDKKAHDHALRRALDL